MGRGVQIDAFLNPLDLSADTEIGYHDFFNLPPVPLIRNAQISGRIYALDNLRLPVGMVFGLPATDRPTRGRGRRRRS
jgi:hypothetical protein